MTLDGQRAKPGESLFDESCPFCDYTGPSMIEVEYPDVGKTGGIIVFRPLDPVTAGHRLFVPKRHFASAADAPQVAGAVFEAAADYGRRRYDDFNLITSVGAAATQTVKHLHVHLVPRWPNDGLKLPWSEQTVLPPELSRALRDQSIVVREDGAMFDLVSKWATAPSSTADVGNDRHQADPPLYRHSCAYCGHAYAGIPAAGNACPVCASELRLAEPMKGGTLMLSDKDLLDAIANDLDGKEPFPEDEYLLEIRSKIRDTGRTCLDPASGPVDPEPSGY